MEQWFALKTFRSKRPLLEEDFASLGLETYYPVTVKETIRRGQRQVLRVPLITSLYFVRCEARFLSDYRATHNGWFMFYAKAESFEPGPIDDREMEVFRLVCENTSPNVTFGGEDKAKYHVGDKVRVKEGPFKGFEGHIQRVGKEKCLCVSLSGICVMFVAHIPPSSLEKVELS